jgi:hypothetical protein
VVARPILRDPRSAISPELANDIAVRIEHANLWNMPQLQSFLATSFPKQRFRIKYRCCIRVFVVENWRKGHNHKSEKRAGAGDMSSVDRPAHWENVYTAKGEKEVSVVSGAA